MAITKHKLFLIPIKEGNINMSELVLDEINTFLKNENVVYLNHSISVISKDEHVTVMEGPSYGLEALKNNANIDKLYKYKTVNTYCVLSLVYKDLKDTASDVSKLSEKSKKVVRQAVESNKTYPKPKL